MRSLTLGIVRFLWSGWVWKSGVSFSFRHVLFLPLSGCRQCLQTANISQWRSITLVKNCLWWEFSFFDTKKKIYGSYYKWDYSFIVERRGGFLKLFLILGQVVLDAEVAKVGVEKKEEGADFETAALPENPKARADNPFPIYWPGILQYFCNIFCNNDLIFSNIFAILTWIFLAVESTFSITDVWQQPLFVFDWTLNFLELEKMLQSCFYFWLILENRKIERAAIKDE